MEEFHTDFGYVRVVQLVQIGYPDTVLLRATNDPCGLPFSSCNTLASFKIYIKLTTPALKIG